MRNKIIFSAFTTILLSLSANSQYYSGFGYDDFPTDKYNYGANSQTPSAIPNNSISSPSNTLTITENTTTTTITTDTNKTITIAKTEKETIKKEKRLSRKERKAAAAKVDSIANEEAKLAQKMSEKAEIARLKMLGVYQGKTNVTPMSKEMIALINKAATPGYTEQNTTNNETTVSEGYGK